MNALASSYQEVREQDLAWLGTEPIPAKAYYDPAYFELEREAVFKRSWLQIGHILEIAGPGRFMTRSVEVAGASLLVVHGRDGNIRAFHNVCTHRGTQLVAEESGTASSFPCPYHRWTFSDDGRLRSAPDFERFYLDKSDCGLIKVAADVCGGFIFINLDPSPAQSLREFLGPVADRLDTLRPARATTFSEFVYEIDANWKVNFDNFQENYHLRFIHPRTGAAATAPENPFGYPSGYGFYGPHRSQELWMNPNATPTEMQKRIFGRAATLPPIDDPAHAAVGSVDFKLFPNFHVVGFAWENTFFFTHTTMPLGPEKSRGVIRLYWVGDDDSPSRRFLREYVLAQTRDVLSEDRAAICRSQKGLSSGAITHIHFQLHECLCRHFYNTVNNAVEAYKAELAA